MNERLKRRVYEILWRTQPDDRVTKRLTFFIIILIVANVGAFVIGTIPEVFIREALFFVSLIVFSVVIFTIEFILRVWACTINPKYHDHIRGRIRFMLTPWPIIMLLVIVPLWITVISGEGGWIFRSIVLLLLLRLFQASGSAKVFIKIVKAKRSDLALALLIDLIVLVFASTLMWSIESPVNPAMASIPATMWWGTATLTTVGYGDVVPMTPLGRALGVIVMFAGIATFALPISIVGAGFLEVREQKQKDDDATQKSEEHAVLDHIAKLGELRERGIVTEEEFQSKKKELLSRL
jgi:voltage-gated potassium channel